MGWTGLRSPAAGDLRGFGRAYASSTSRQRCRSAAGASVRSLRHYDRLDRYQYSLGYAFEHKFTSDFIFRQNLRYGEVDSQVNAAANIYGFFFDPVGQTMTTRMPIDAYDTADFFAVDNQLLVQGQTGPLWHDAVVGFDYRNENSYRDFKVGAPSLLNIFDPVYGQPFVLPTTKLANEAADQEQLGLYAQDQIRLGGWLASVGGRYDWVTSDVSNLLTNATDLHP